MRGRFTISLHRILEGRRTDDGRGSHLDCFFAADHLVDRPLETWSTSIGWPATGENSSRRLPDHRACYLDYDGEVSGDRGCVQRLVTGTYQLIEHDAERFVFVVESVAVVDSANENTDTAKRAAALHIQLVASLGDRVHLTS